MDAENGAVDDGCEDEEVKNLTAGLPDRGIAVFVLALFVEAVDLCNLPRLMVTPDENDPIRVSATSRLATTA